MAFFDIASFFWKGVNLQIYRIAFVVLFYPEKQNIRWYSSEKYRKKVISID